MLSQLHSAASVPALGARSVRPCLGMLVGSTGTVIRVNTVQRATIKRLRLPRQHCVGISNCQHQSSPWSSSSSSSSSRHHSSKQHSIKQRRQLVVCASATVADVAACLSGKVSTLLAHLSALPWVAVAAVLAAGVLLGLAVSKAISSYVAREFDPDRTSLENAELRQKVEDLQQLMMKVEPLAYKSMQLRFTKGINKAVILGMVDTMLANKEVNIWWLPDQLERIIYFNMMTLMLSVLDEVVDGMSISFAGHNVRLSLTYLDVEKGEGFGPAVTAKTEALIKSAMQPVKQYT